MQKRRSIATAGGALVLSLAMIAAADADAASVDWRFYSGILLYPGSGADAVDDRVFADRPIARSDSIDSLPDMSGRTSVDLGVLRASASAPAYQGQTGIFSAGAVVGYHDTMTFGQSGQGMIPVGFVFRFDGGLTGSTAAQVDLQMIVAGPQGSVTTPYGAVNFHTDGRFDGSDPGACGTPTGVSPGFPQGYQCSVDNVYNFRRTGAKTQGVPFTFNILAGQAVDVYSLFLTAVFPYDDNPGAVLADFYSTARLTAIDTPAGTTIQSAFGSNLVFNGGVATYLPLADIQAVSEPPALAVLAVGVIGLGLSRRTRRRKDSARPSPSVLAEATA